MNAAPHDETDWLYSTHPRDLAARFGQRAIQMIRAGAEVYETARLAASFAGFALASDPVLTTGQTAAVLAAAIELNCARQTRGEIDQATWGAEQNRVWSLAVEAHLTADVIALVCPSLAAREGRRS